MLYFQLATIHTDLFSHHHQEHDFLVVVAAARIAGAPAPAPAEAEAGAEPESTAVTDNVPKKGGFEFLQKAK